MNTEDPAVERAPAIAAGSRLPAGTAVAGTAVAGTAVAGTAPAGELPADAAPAGSPAGSDGRWRDPALPVADRVADLLAQMTLTEKIAQLSSVWLRDGNSTVKVAPEAGRQSGTDEMADQDAAFDNGLGQLTRVFGTAPVDWAAGIDRLTRLQDQVVSGGRFGIPAIVHEECLTGFTAWTASVFPTPLAWGASFNPDAVREMAAAIGRHMHAAGIHQGLAPVLDVVRDARWGRVEETIGEDPYLVGIIGTAYVRGLQSAGLIATLKHFAGYSASGAGRNLAPVEIGPRQLADIILPPFEMAIRHGGARSVMPSYTSIDGVPTSADADMVTRMLREEFGFDGIVVSDYRAITFLETLHRVAASPSAAGALALRAGIDVELPDQACYGPPLAEAVRAGEIPEALVDRSVARVLRQKFDLGLLDPGWSAVPPDGDGSADLDPPANRHLARLLAEQSVVLLANRGQPAAGGQPAGKSPALPLSEDLSLTVVGPLADDPLAFFGCYSFPRHLGYKAGSDEIGVAVPTVLAALRSELGDAVTRYERGCEVQSADTSGIPAAVAAAAGADAVIAVLGDESGMFGRGTSGEGCDATDLRLPGAQQELLDALAGTGKPVILVLVTGRPYAIGGADRLAAIVQAFFPGEEGGTAIAGVLSGRVVPSGKLPIEMPANPGSQPSSYLRPRLAGKTDVSSVDPTPLFPFGHGLSYTSFEFTDLAIRPADADHAAGPGQDCPDCVIATDGTAEISCLVRNTGGREGDEVVQLYLGDPVAQVARPERYLAGFARVPLAPGQAKRATFRLHADRTSFHGRDGAGIVEPGLIEIGIGASSSDIRLAGTLALAGQERRVGRDRILLTPVCVTPATSVRAGSEEEQ
jgi:beta-xylosidase